MYVRSETVGCKDLKRYREVCSSLRVKGAGNNLEVELQAERLADD